MFIPLLRIKVVKQDGMASIARVLANTARIMLLVILCQENVTIMDVAITSWSRHFVPVTIYYSFIIYRLIILFSLMIY